MVLGLGMDVASTYCMVAKALILNFLEFQERCLDALHKPSFVFVLQNDIESIVEIKMKIATCESPS